MDPFKTVHDTAHLRCMQCAEAMTDDWSVIKAAAQFHTALHPTHAVIVSHTFTMHRGRFAEALVKVRNGTHVIGNELNTWLPSREDHAITPEDRFAITPFGWELIQKTQDTGATDAPVREYGDAPIREYGMPCVYCNRTDGPYRYELDTRCSACNRRWMGAGRRVLWEGLRGTVTHVSDGGLRFCIRWDFDQGIASYPREWIVPELKNGNLQLNGMED